MCHAKRIDEAGVIEMTITAPDWVLCFFCDAACTKLALVRAPFTDGSLKCEHFWWFLSPTR